MGYERIYIIFLCINLVLMLGGFSITGNANIAGASYGMPDQADATGLQGTLSMLGAVVDFFFGGGIIGLLAAAGTPYELQVIIGAPFMVMGILALITIITSGVNIARSLMGL